MKVHWLWLLLKVSGALSRALYFLYPSSTLLPLPYRDNIYDNRPIRAGLFGTRSRSPVEGSMYNSDDDRSHMLDQREQRIPTRGLQHDDAHGRAFHESHSFRGLVQLPGRHSPPLAIDQRDYTLAIAGAHAVLPDDRDAIYRGEENPSRYPPPHRYYDSYRV